MNKRSFIWEEEMCDQCSEYRNLIPGDEVFVEVGPNHPSGPGKVISAEASSARIEMKDGRTYIIYNPWLHKIRTTARE